MIEHSTIYNLKNEVDYQNGSVVSKVIQKQNSGNATIFAFDKGEFLSPHSAPFDATAVIIYGSAEITIGENVFNLQEMEFIKMPANVTHGLKATERFKMLLFMFK